MKTRNTYMLLLGAMVMASCNPGDEADPTADLDVGYDSAGENQVVDIPDSLGLATVDQNADSVIDRQEFEGWLAAQPAFASRTTAADSAAADDAGVTRSDTLVAATDTAAPDRGQVPDSTRPVWPAELDLTLDELEWQSSGQYLYTRNTEPGLFEDWDANGDARLDPQEVLAGLEERGGGMPAGETSAPRPDSIRTVGQAADVLFRLWDLDGNGTLDPDEYRAGIAVWWM